MKVKLIIDDRERSIFPYLETELYNINYVVKRINVGDYSIINSDNKILACFERKSLEDFSASIKDGRYSNKEGMIELRNKTGCRLFYIVEGDAYPKPNKTYGNIPYKYIESAIFHLMMRDGFYIIETNNILHTAQKLSRMVESIERLDKVNKTNITNEDTDFIADNEDDSVDGIVDKIYDEIYGTNLLKKSNVSLGKSLSESLSKSLSKSLSDKIDKNPVCNYVNDVNDVTDVTGITDIPNELLARSKKSDIDIVRELWACFNGISIITADVFINQVAIIDIVCKKLSKEQIENIKYASGKKINKRVIASLLYISLNTEIRLLSCIPGISVKTAREILSKIRLKQILSYEIESIAVILVGNKKIGNKRATNIKRYFYYKK